METAYRDRIEGMRNIQSVNTVGSLLIVIHTTMWVKKNINVDDFYGEIKCDFLSSFEILWQNTWDWMAYKGKKVAVLASAVSNLYRLESPGKKEPQLNKRPHWLTCRQASQAFSWFLWDCAAPCGLCTPGQMVLDGIMKKTEKPLRTSQ